MEVENKLVWDGMNAANALGTYKLPVPLALKVARLTAALRTAREPMEKVRKDLVLEYALRDKDGKIVHDDKNNPKPDPDRVEEFSNKMDELLAQQCKVDFDEKIKLPVNIASTCDKCHHNMDRPLEIEPNIIALLLPFFDAS